MKIIKNYFYINECINIENNINYINKIKENINKSNLIKYLKIKIDEKDEVNKCLKLIKNIVK